MNRDRVLLELSPAIRAHLLAVPPKFVDWKRIAYAVAVDVGRRLLRNSGEGAWNGKLRDLIRTEPAKSPAVADLLEQLPHGPQQRRWSNRTISQAVTSHFQIEGVENLRIAIGQR